MRKSKSLFFVTLLVYVFLIGPLVVIMAASFSDTTYLKFPGEGFTLRWYHQILQVKSFGSAAKNSIIIAFAGTFLALLLGLPAAYALNRYRFRGKELIKSLFLSPVLIPVIVLGFVMLRYVVNRFKLPAMPSLLIGHTILSIPYVMRVVTSSLANFDFSMEEAARILAVINSFNNVSLSAFLTRAGVSMLPIEMMAYVEYHFDPTIAALATLLMVITLGVMLVIEKTLGLKSVV